MMRIIFITVTLSPQTLAMIQIIFITFRRSTLTL
uniref:Uncharacterized protein n=1 Tax=Anguilla anguilla TaxID=7936 RepID=A0A0E9TWM6_ANGAN